MDGVRRYLRVLGDPGLLDASGEAIPLQPKRLAIVAYIALSSRTTAVDREEIRALFWPEQEPSAGRNALNQALHGIRRALAPDELSSDGRLLSLPAEGFGCDAWDFEARAAAGDPEGALALYRGPLLHGFTLQGAPGFDAWAAERRAGFERRAEAARTPPASHPGRRRWRGAAVSAAILVAAALGIWKGGLGSAWGGEEGRQELEVVLGTTSSEAARQAYRAGDASFRSGRFSAAVEELGRAVEADSTFAFAHYRLSRAANWSGQSSLAIRAAQAAAAHSELLPAHLRDGVRAWLMVLEGRPEEAEVLYRTVLAEDSLNQDALAELADIRFHWGGYLGYPAVDTRADWERLLVLDPTNVEAIRHLARVLAVQRDSAAFRELAGRLAALDPGREAMMESSLLEAFAFGDSAARAAATPAVETLEEPQRRALARAAAVAAPHRPETAGLLGPVLVFGHSFTSWEQGEVLVRAQMDLARGRIERARALIDSAEALGPRAGYFRAGTLLVPVVGGSRDEMRAALTSLARSDAGASDFYAEPWRLYLSGSLAARLGDTLAARAAEERLLRHQDPRDGASNAVAFAPLYARVVQAERLRAAGRPADALSALGEPHMPPDRRLPHIWSFPRAHERILRANLLADTGRHDEAVRWYRTFPDPGGYDLMYLPAALLGEAQAYEATGRGAEAAAVRERLEALLRDADARVRRTP